VSHGFFLPRCFTRNPFSGLSAFLFSLLFAFVVSETVAHSQCAPQIPNAPTLLLVTASTSTPPPPATGNGNPGCVTVDSTFPGYTTSTIDDGVVSATGGNSSTWASADDLGTDHWINVAFPSARQINSVILHWAYNNYRQTYMTAQSVNVEYWTGSAYQSVSYLSYPGSDVASSSAYFPTVTTSQLRFVMPAAQGNPAYPSVFWLTELDYGVDVVSPVVTAPKITPSGGNFTGSASVTMSTPTANSSIYYTTDGSTPSQSSTPYTGPMTVTANATIKARAFRSGYNPSTVTSAPFLISPASLLPQTTGTAYYVAKSGSNSNSCTRARSMSTPKLTVAAGLACMVGGDTLVISSGTYDEYIRNSQLISGSDDSRRTFIMARPGDTVILRPTGGDPATGGVVWINNKSYITFDHLVFDGVNTSGGPTFYMNHASASGITLQNSQIMNSFGESCITITGANHKVISNIVHDCGDSVLDHGIYIGVSDNALVEYNEVYNVRFGFGIHLYHTPINNAIVRYNRVHNGGYRGMIIGSGNDNRAYGNQVWNHPSTGIEVAYQAINNKVVNNTIYNSGICIFVHNASTTIVQNNLCLAGSTNSVTQGANSFSLTADHNVFTTDLTLVVDARNGNFQISNSAASSLIRQGADQSSIFTVDANRFIITGAYDVGALQSGY
jgi:parallel beta-helix repeat protein